MFVPVWLASRSALHILECMPSAMIGYLQGLDDREVREKLAEAYWKYVPSLRWHINAQLRSLNILLRKAAFSRLEHDSIGLSHESLHSMKSTLFVVPNGHWSNFPR